MKKTLLQIREERGITRVELSKQIGKCVEMIRKWERGISIPNLYSVTDILDFYGIKFEDVDWNT